MATIDFVGVRFQVILATGAEAGAQVFTYAAGTLTPLATYTNQSGLSANTNPVICDANGMAQIWFTPSVAYRVIVRRSVANGSTLISDDDNLYSSLVPGGAASFSSLAVAGSATIGSSAADTLAVGGNVLVTDTNGRVRVGGSTTMVDEFTVESSTAGSPNIRWLKTGGTFWRAGIEAITNRFRLCVNSTVTLLSVATNGDLYGLGLSLVRRKSATLGRASTATLADDPDLSVPLEPGQYSVTCRVPVWATTSGAGGFRFAMAFSGTATSAFFTTAGFANGASYPAAATYGLATAQTAAAIIAGTGVTAADYFTISGSITVSVAGNLTFQWAQNTSNANAANVGLGASISCLRTG